MIVIIGGLLRTIACIYQLLARAEIDNSAGFALASATASGGLCETGYAGQKGSAEAGLFDGFDLKATDAPIVLSKSFGVLWPQSVGCYHPAFKLADFGFS